MPKVRLNHPRVISDRTRGNIRYLNTRQEVPDDLNPEQRQEIEVAEKNLPLAVSGRTGSRAWSRWRIAQVQRSADGNLILNPEHIPPCVVLQASPVIHADLRGLLGLIAGRASSMAEERAQHDAVLKDIDEVAPFLFFLALNQQAAVLRQIHETPDHPLQLLPGAVPALWRPVRLRPEARRRGRSAPLRPR